MKRANPTTISRFFQAKRARPQTDERLGKSARVASSNAAAAPNPKLKTVEREPPVEVADAVKAEVKEEAVPAAQMTAPTSVTSALEQDVQAIAQLNAELRTHFFAPHLDRPRVKAERAACLQRIRATMRALHPEVLSRTLPPTHHFAPQPLRHALSGGQLRCSCHTAGPCMITHGLVPPRTSPPPPLSPLPHRLFPTLFDDRAPPLQPHGRRVRLVRRARSDINSHRAHPLVALLVPLGVV